jgi:DNA polymerase I-like protein with 3'-5' exonuclease and polymerase domains
VYGQFHQLKSDDSGTISGRFSSSAPNLENIPARDEELGPLVRSLFEPENGEDWYSDDYSQIEYRGIVHYGIGPSADRCRKMYNEDPKTDFHNMVVDMTGIPRKRAKNINFGKSYGMGVATAAAQMGCTEDEARFFIDQYDREMPFVGELLTRCAGVVEKRGFLTTILGRRARFEMWENKKWSGKGDACLPLAAAQAKWGVGNIRLAGTYRALNRLIQGSAADIFKKALADIWKAGICDVLGAPLNLVHDEVCWSVPKNAVAHKAHDEAVNLMRNVVKLSVPLLVDTESGPNWGAMT